MGKWKNEQIGTLIQLYIEYNMTSDKLISEESSLKSFVGKLNIKIKNTECFTAEEVANKILSLRKAGKLPRLRR